jgi:hypothetical protein
MTHRQLGTSSVALRRMRRNPSMARSAPRKKKTVDDTTEANMKKAAQDLKDGIYEKMIDAAKAYSVPYCYALCRVPSIDVSSLYSKDVLCL